MIIMDASAVMNGFTQKRFGDFDDGGRMCPILADPYPECHCIDMNSLKKSDTITYGLKDFRCCAITQFVPQ
jgi:hypothetical protein